MATVHLICSHNYTLVALSVLIAMFTSYAALDLAGRVTAAGGWVRVVWLLGGAGAMGTGIWSMHYIGMLACILPVPVAYHWPTVLLSLFAAILASVIALYVVSRQKMSAFRAFAGSFLMGGGIASMHYIGMAAMRMSAISHYDSLLVVLSVVFAVLISLAALWITFHFRDEKAATGWRKIAGAVVMGAAIPIMHYTGMAAAHFTPSGMPADLSRAISISTLGTGGIVAATLIVLGLALLTAWVDRRFAAQTLELQEEKLHQSEAYLSEAQRLSHTGSFGWRVATGEIVWSEETYRIFQYDRTTTPTVESVLQRVHPEDAAQVKQTIERASQDGKDFEHEYRLVMPDSSVKYVHVVAHVLHDESGSVELVGAVMDVTERKRAEMLLGGEKRLLEMIARGDSRALILDALCHLVEELASGSLSSILLLDPKANRLRHGAAPSLPLKYTEAIDGLVIGPCVGSCGTAAYRAEPVIVSDIVSDPLWADYRALALAHGLQACWSTPIRSSAGSVLGTFAVYYREPRRPTTQEHNLMEQITHLASIAVEREQAEEALRHAQANLAHMTRLTTMGELTASIAHEVNQPLAAVVNNANACIDLLGPTPKRRGEGGLSDAGQLEEVRDALAEIIDDADRASTVIMRLRQLAKKTPVEKKSLLDLKDVVNDVLALARYESARRRITISTDLPNDLPSVSGDRVQLQQVLLNLIVNGMDAMDTIEESKRALIICGCCETRDGMPAALLRVQDSGTGLKPEEIDRLFEAFYTTKPQGMGMGLSISRSIIEAHGGRLWAESNQGAGASFLVSLPGASHASS